MIMLKLTQADIDYIIDELTEANNATRYYLNDQFNNIDEEEEKDLSKQIQARAKIIVKLIDAAKEQRKRSKKK